MKVWSATDEDKIIQEHFVDRVGRYLDVGAFDGCAISNTRALLDRGWKGVAVEPNPEMFLRLVEKMKGLPVECVNTALGAENRICRFYVWPGERVDLAGSSFMEGFCGARSRIRKHGHPPTIWAAITSVETFLAMFPGPYDFIDIDAEGMDWEILRSLDLDALKTSLVCVEFGHHLLQFQKWCQHRPWEIFWKGGNNLIFKREGT